MFTTTQDTMRYTGRDVSNEELFMAQSLIEAYIGRVEAEVDNPNDKENLAKATAYQAVYMKDNWDTVFTQIDAVGISSFGGSIAFRDNGSSPYIATAARFALQNLSWRGSKNVRVGRILGNRSPWRNYDWTRDDN